jgi:hypothetical protein
MLDFHERGHEVMLQGADSAPSFASRAECKQWIDNRVMRFSIKIAAVAGPGGPIVTTQKNLGRVIDTTKPDYQKMATDEPLKKHAKPVKDGAVWRAAIMD